MVLPPNVYRDSVHVLQELSACAAAMDVWYLLVLLGTNPTSNFSISFRTLPFCFPILAFGILDQDVVAEVLMKVPSLYKDGNTLGIHYSGRTFWLWMLEGTWSAAVCTFSLLVSGRQARER